MGLALDEPISTDRTFDIDGVRFLVGQDLARWIPEGQTVKVSFHKVWKTFTVAIEGADCW